MVNEKEPIFDEIPDDALKDFVIRRDSVVSLKFTRNEKKVLVSMARAYGIAPSTLCYLIVKQRLNAYDDEKVPVSELELI